MSHVAKTIEHESEGGGEVAVSSAATPMTMLAAAIDRGMTPDVIDKLMALEERWDKSKARKAFDVAIAAAKADIPVIVKNREGHNSKRYADFAAVARVVDPIISKHGLSYRFRAVQTDRISVTCVLSHEAGHYEENTLAALADKTGSKNDIQALGSTLTYLQRYSLVQALGLAASDDDDGRGSGEGSSITDEQAQRLLALINEVGANAEAFCKYFRIEGVPALPAKDFDRAVSALEAKRAKA